jgi:hypothetical protein
MANTLKFGNGQWATKVGSTLAYNDEGGNFKPLPFNFTRSTSATRVNKDGLIEVVKNNKPRIDFLNNSNGALLLEPSRTNLIQYSEDFSNAYWNKFDSSVTSGFASPDGSTNAFKLIEGNTNTQHGLLRSNFPINVQRTLSVFVKKGENERFFISDYNKFGYTIGVIFNLTSGTIESNQNDSIYLNPKIEPYSNGWYRCSVTWTNTTGLTVPFFGNAISGTNSYQGDGVSGIYVFGAQFEEASYSTSYIPTQGTISARAADTCNGAGNSQIFNNSEGVLFANIASLSDTVSTYNSIGLGVNSANERIALGFQAPSNIYIFKRTTSSWITAKSSNIKLYNKVAISYNTNDNHFWLNGFKIASDTTIGDLVQPIELGFEASYGGEQFYGNTKQIAYYDEILTDLELEYMTSYRSLNEMVTELNLNAL